MIEPITQANAGAAVAILAKGFPNRPHSFWLDSLKRIERFGGNAETGVPIGQLLMSESRPAGVLLTPSSFRYPGSGPPQRIVNMSSWYIEPEQRWRAPVMLRKAMRDRDAIYTDLTPTAEVQAMLPRLGFRQLNRGVHIHILPALAALAPFKARVCDIDHKGHPGIPAATLDLLERHRRLGCLTASLDHDGKSTALMFRRKSVRGVPGAVLVFSDDNRMLNQHFGSVARYLLKEGVMALVTDDFGGEERRGHVHKPKGIKFVTHSQNDAMFQNRTDYAGSELSLMDI